MLADFISLKTHAFIQQTRKHIRDESNHFSKLGFDAQDIVVRGLDVTARQPIKIIILQNLAVALTLKLNPSLSSQ